DVAQRHVGTLLARDVDAGDPSHVPPLTLALLVLRLGADHEDHALSPDDLALVAALLDARADLHLVPHPSRDATSLEVIWRQLHEDLVARDEPDEVHPHLPGDVCQDRMAVLELH